jgi:hypothetical protein
MSDLPRRRTRRSKEQSTGGQGYRAKRSLSYSGAYYSLPVPGTFFYDRLA